MKSFTLKEMREDSANWLPGKGYMLNESEMIKDVAAEVNATATASIKRKITKKDFLDRCSESERGYQDAIKPMISMLVDIDAMTPRTLLIKPNEIMEASYRYTKEQEATIDNIKGLIAYYRKLYFGWADGVVVYDVEARG